MIGPLFALAMGIVLCLIGVRIGFTTLVVAFAAVAYERGLAGALTLTGQQVESIATSSPLSVILLFILMGVFVHEADLSRDLYTIAQTVFDWLPRALVYSTVLASAGFSATCGPPVAKSATMC